MSQSFSVEAMLSVNESGFSKGFRNAINQVKSLENSITGTESKSTGFFKSLSSGSSSSAFNIKGLVVQMAALTGGIATLNKSVSRYDTLNNYPKIMAQMGFSSDDATKSINDLSDGIQGLPTTLDGIVAGTKKIALLTGNLEGATKTSLALNNAFIMSGSSSEEASRGLVQYTQMLSKGKVDMQSWYTLQETMGGALKEVAESFGIAGGNTNLLYDALQDGTITFDEFNERIIELDGGLNGFAERAKTASGGIKTSMTNMANVFVRQTTNMMNAIDGLLEKNGLPDIVGLIEKARVSIDGALSGIVGSIGKLDKAQIGAIGGFLGLQMAMPAIISGFVGLSSAMDVTSNIVGKMPSAFSGAFDGIGSSLTFLKGGFQPVTDKVLSFGSETGKVFNDVGTIFMAVTRDQRGMVSDFIGNIPSLSMFGDSFKMLGDKMSGLGINTDSIKGKMGAVSNAFTKSMPAIANFGGAVGNGATKLAGLAMKMIAPAAFVGVIIAGMGFAQQAFGDEINQMVNMAITQGPQIITNLATGLLTALPSIMESGTNLLNSLMEVIIANAPAAISAGVGIVAGLVSGVANGIPKLIPTALTMIETILTSIISSLPQLLSAGLEILVSIASGIQNNVPQIVSTIVNVLNQLISTIITNLPQILEAGVKIIVSLALGLVNAIPQLIGAIPSIISSIWNAFTSVNWGEVGMNIISGIASGIASAVGSLVSSAVSAASAAFEGVKNFLGIHSPSRLFMKEIGKYIPLGIAVGIDKDAGAVTASIEKAIELPKIDGFSSIDVLKNYEFGNSDNSIGNSSSDNVLAAIEKIGKMQIVLDTGELVGATTDKYDESIGDSAILQERWAF